MGFQDLYSSYAADYRKFRPLYPAEIFAWLADIAPNRKIAWDCATGNGQAALGLVEHFDGVIATDASVQQIENAVEHSRIRYLTEQAEQTSIPTGSISVITCAQAAHWFDHEKFYAEVHRVLDPNGILAVWCYGLCEISDPIDGVVEKFYQDVVGQYWPKERHFIEEAYVTLPFPYPDLGTPDFYMTAHWSLDQFLGYLTSWSAVNRYRKAENKHPFDEILWELTGYWGADEREVVWPLHLRVGRKTKQYALFGGQN